MSVVKCFKVTHKSAAALAFNDNLSIRPFSNNNYNLKINLKSRISGVYNQDQTLYFDSLASKIVSIVTSQRFNSTSDTSQQTRRNSTRKEAESSNRLESSPISVWQSFSK